MDSRMILDRIPLQFCEGPFWGNGKMGAVLYVRDDSLCISVDHVKLWELRETLPDEPKAAFQQILQHKKEYLSGDPRYVEDTNIFDDNIGRTRLPALAIELKLPGKVTGFWADTDLQSAQTALKISLEDGSLLCGNIYLDSCVNIFSLELDHAEGGLKVKALGWDLESPKLKVLKSWNYEPCRLEEKENSFCVTQHFGKNQTAVLSGKQIGKENKAVLAVSIDVDDLEKEQTLKAAGEKLTAAYLENREHYLKAHEADWAAFWNRSSIEVPNERLQEAFAQEMYKLYCNEREDSMPITLQGIWNPNHRMPAWYGDLHNDLNVQSCYWPAYKTGNVNLVRPYIEYYAAAMPRLEERAWKLFGIKNAIHIPTMMAPDGTGAASEWCFWNTLLGPELFVAVDFVWFYEYSREQDTLRDKIYPFIEKVIHLYEEIAYEKEDGYLHIPFTTSPEVDRDGYMLVADDATFTLSSLHFLCKKMAEYAKILGKDGDRFTKWSERLAPVKTNETGLPVYAGIDVFKSHRHFCQLYPIYPLGEEAHNEVANKSLDTAINQGFLEYAAFSFPYMGIFAARCGRGNMCRTMLEIYCMVFRSRNSFTVNGDPYQNGVLRISDTNAGESSDAFTLESGFFVPTLLCEMFVHRSRDKVWMLMGIPDEWKDCSCKQLVVEGGHCLSIEQTDYQLRRVVLTAGCEEKITLCWKEKKAPKRIFRSREEITCGQEGQCTIFVKTGEEWILEF